MRYNGDSNGQDLCTLCDDKVNTSILTYPLDKKTRAANKTLRTVWCWIFEVFGGWQYDDNNLSGEPETINTLTSGTNKYILPEEVMALKGVDIKKLNDTNFVPLIPITTEEMRERGLSDKNLFTATGVPKYYSVSGDNVYVYPTPNYTQTSSIRLTYDRGVSAFTPSDTTKTPGFAAEFHEVVAVGMSLEYARNNGIPTWQIIQEEMDGYEKRIKGVYAKRFLEKFPAKIRVADSISEYE